MRRMKRLVATGIKRKAKVDDLMYMNRVGSKSECEAVEVSSRS